jgi:hypothetical protein
MAKRKYTAEQIIGILRQVEVAISNGRPTLQACQEAGIVLRECTASRHFNRAAQC